MTSVQANSWYRQESIEVQSFKNENGYNIDDGTYTGTSGTFIPRLETAANIALPISQQLDIYGQTLQYYGRARYDAKLTDSSIAVFNGTDNSLSFTDLTGVTIASYEGTGVPSKSGNDINYTAGTALNLVLSDGTTINFVEGSGTTVYDVSGNGNDGTVNGTIAGFWDTSDAQRPNNLLDGFDLWEEDASPGTYVRVPYDVNGDPIKTSGDSITGYTWVSTHAGTPFGHNGAESTITQLESEQIYAAAEAMETAGWTNLMFSGTSPIGVSYDDIPAAAYLPDTVQWLNDIFTLDPLFEGVGFYAEGQVHGEDEGYSEGGAEVGGQTAVSRDSKLAR